MITPRDENSEHIPRSELEAEVAAARCRGCGTITWLVSLVEGLKRAPARHAKDCEKPTGRLDLLMRLGVNERAEFMGGRLLRTMTDTEVLEAEKELKRWKSRTT